MDDWGLQAVVRGCSDEYPATISSFGSIYNRNLDDDIFNFPDFSQANNNNYYNNDNYTLLFNELDELCKPFCNSTPADLHDPFSSQIHNNVVTSPESFSDEAKLKPEEIISSLDQSAIVGATPKSTTAHATKYKRRKNQHKRVVVQVTADDLSSDKWAWRKYGQKPIKGSPYPRSYYRCSSSKGCLARKQVEQSCEDPGMFIITYSAEHSHGPPTRRSSLAGTNRHKFTPAGPKSPSSMESCLATPKGSTAVSPTTPLRPSNIEQVLINLQKPIKNIEDAIPSDEQIMVEEIISKDNESVISDMIFNDEFFMGLEDLDALISDSNFYDSNNFGNIL